MRRSAGAVRILALTIARLVEVVAAVAVGVVVRVAGREGRDQRVKGRDLSVMGGGADADGCW